jgi:hypothetical protein
MGTDLEQVVQLPARDEKKQATGATHLLERSDSLGVYVAVSS